METPIDIDEVIERWDVPEEVRLALVFTGMVQGVGFRWTTQALARQSGVAGWVRNEDDGNVSCELQGTGAAVCDVLRASARPVRRRPQQVRDAAPPGPGLLGCLVRAARLPRSWRQPPVRGAHLAYDSGDVFEVI